MGRNRRKTAFILGGCLGLAVSLGVGLAVLKHLPGARQDRGGLRFEAAAIKPDDPGDSGRHSHINSDPGRVSIRMTNLQDIIEEAYGVNDRRFEGPSWLLSASYDIVATSGKPSTDTELNAMLRALLVDRFKLAVHRETRQLPVYALVVDRGGPKMKPAPPNAGDEDNSHSDAAGIHMNATETMQAFAGRFLSQRSDRQVIDRTNLAGMYTFSLDFLDPRRNPNDSGDPASLPTLPQALKERLGLKLVAQTGPVEVLVVDHCERTPTPDE